MASSASGIEIDFEDLSDLDAVTTQYIGLGVTFAGATVLTAGISLNEFDFPPHSGVNVIASDLEIITITFSDPVVSVGGFFTYTASLGLTATDSLGGTHNVSSAFSENFVSSGNPPNESRLP